MSLLNYLQLKQEVWDILQAKIDANELKSINNEKPTLFWGRREIDDFPKAICPEIQVISDIITGGKSISDQQPFYFPRDDSLILRIIDKHPDKKIAESSSTDLGLKVMAILQVQGTMGGKVLNPGISTIRFDEIGVEANYYFGTDIVYLSTSRN